MVEQNLSLFGRVKKCIIQTLLIILENLKRLFDEPKSLEVKAKPGLVTLLDLALYRSVQGELTATACAVHALLHAWLDLKHEAQLVLKNDVTNSFARYCLEAACDAIEKIATDRFASSANLSEAYEPGFSSTTLSGQISIEEALDDTGRRTPKRQRARDCWETARLVCPDHVWADDVFLTGQRLLRLLTKQLAPISTSTDDFVLQTLVQQDLPMRLHQFRTATEANAVVLKRMYLVKSEYRAPFRAFLEAHQTVQRAPSLDLVESYLEQKGKQQEGKLQDLLERPDLLEALVIEQTLEDLEQQMAKKIYGFTELARIIDYKKARLQVVPGVVDEEQLQPLQDLMRRLKYCLCRKVGPESSTGLRPLLLDLQGIPRDEGLQANDLVDVEERISTLMQQLQTLKTLMSTRNAFVMDKSSFEAPGSIVKECSRVDTELWEAQCLDWFDLVKRQHRLTRNFSSLAEEIRMAEIEASIQAASPESLILVKERLERLSKDRELRFEVLRDMVEEVCSREMNLKLLLQEPCQDAVLTLPSTSVVGLVGLAMQLAGEPLPFG